MMPLPERQGASGSQSNARISRCTQAWSVVHPSRCHSKFASMRRLLLSNVTLEKENKLFSQLFTGSGGSPVITGLSKGDYDSLRDYCYLSASTSLPKTLLLQVDELWHPAQEKTMLV